MTDKLREIIRESLEEMGVYTRKPSTSQLFTDYLKRFFSLGQSVKNFVKIESQDIDKTSSVIRIYFKLIKDADLVHFISIPKKIKSDWRIYPYDNLICFEMRFDPKNIPQKF